MRRGKAWRWVLLLMAAPACEGACMACEGHVASYVDQPTTTDELRAWAEQRGLVAKIGPLKRNASGNVACGHSPACLLLLPVLAANMLLPATLEQGSVSDDQGTVLYSGVFDLRGRLIHARVKDGDVYRELERMNLDRLGEHPIVERARVRIDGDAEVREAVPIIPQIDLNTMYAEALANERDADDRGRLVNEQLQYLPGEALSAVMKRYAALEKIEDEELEVVMTRICKRGKSEAFTSLLELTVERGGPRAAVASVPCVIREEGVDAKAGAALAPRVAEAACEKAKKEDALVAFERLAKVTPAPMNKAIDRCEPPARRTVLRVWAGDRPKDEALVVALQDPASSADLMRRMTPRREEDRRVMVTALDSKRATSLRIAKTLAGSTTGSPTPAEAKKAAEVYAAKIGRAVQPHDLRHHLLRWISRCDAPCKRAAVEVLRGADPLQTHHQAALLLLAEEYQRFPKTLDGVDAGRIRRLNATYDNFNADTLIAFALVEAGCNTDEVKAAAREVAAGKKPTPCSAFSKP